jgi:hypothetical protein
MNHCLSVHMRLLLFDCLYDEYNKLEMMASLAFMLSSVEALRCISLAFLWVDVACLVNYIANT